MRSNKADKRTGAKVGSAEAELTGNSRLVSNVVSGWISHLVVLLAGFIVPRLIYDTQGVIPLGIWDFCWATAKYLSMAKLGLTATTGRFTALYNASGERENLHRMLSSILFWQGSISAFALSIVILGLIFAPAIVTLELEPYLAEIRLVGGMLALSVIVEMTAGPARGVLTGNHRWVINNTLNAASDAGCALGMIIVLIAGGEIVALAATNLVIMSIVEIIRAFIATRFLKGFRIFPGNFLTRESLALLRFGITSSLVVIPRVAITQSTFILLASAAGASALAIFARPMSLIFHITTIVNKFSLLMMPMASSLVGLGQQDELRRMFVWSSKTALAIGAPFIAILATQGDVILTYWMGGEFASSSTPLVLALGAIIPIAMTAGTRLLVGINMHGRLAVVSILTAILVYVAMYLLYILPNGWSPDSAAVLVAVTLTSSIGLSVIVIGCSCLNMSIFSFVTKAFATPLALILALCGINAVARAYAPGGALIGLLVGIGISGGAYLVLLWQFFLTEQMRNRVHTRLRKSFGIGFE